ncbi:MAG: serine/threonine protein kinase [Acidobacteria bacterium]|nr:serine/threonine protein kinase [Acidobacteriota bacterium]
MIGKTLGHYQITSQLGKGGMGEVYQAKDQKLGRDVAIKVLPEEFARDADRVARFQREAKLLASLNHPNIAAIHGLEESGGTNFLVLELVPGETLADRIKAGPIPVEESLKLALQIAEALEAAHEKGVIHRDLKPANIKVTPESKVKVLDFGLAKAYAGDREDVNLSNSPTLSDAATQQGVILGTAAYMSPEQARGKPVDKRADIWAFGCVLFEMLTGRAAFSGRDVTDILAAVIRSEPDWKRLPANLHWRLRELLERCLEKEAKDRYSGINDARVEIQKVLADPSGLFAQSVTAKKAQTRLRSMLPWAVAILGIVLVGVAVWNLRKPEPRQVMRFEYELPEGQQLNGLAVSPDGKQFVYGTANGLYIRSVDELTAKLIAGTEGSTQQPFFSPDGKSIGYFSVNDRQLKKIAISGGAPVTLCAVTQLLGAWWGADNTILYGQIPGDMMQVSGNGELRNLLSR